MNKIKMLSIRIFGLIFISSFINVQAQQVLEKETNPIDISYLESKRELEDYILDTGDFLEINFVGISELQGYYSIDTQGEIYFPGDEDIKELYVRGLTISELETLLENRFKDILISPDIHIRILRFKPSRVLVTGEVRSPGLITFDSFTGSDTEKRLILEAQSQKIMSGANIGGMYIDKNKTFTSQQVKNPNLIPLYNNSNLNNKRLTNSKIIPTENIKIENELVATISKAIKKAGGLTSYSDISKIEIVRDIPKGKGGGRKRAVINFQSYINESDTTNDIRIFDGDSIFIPSLKEKDPNTVPNSILSGVSPRFIGVTVSGRIENPGLVAIPVEGTLSDVMNLSGPRMPLSGKVFLIRYQKDGKLLRKNINYSSNAAPGSLQNPYLLSGDLITVKNSILGKASGTLRAITVPFIGINQTKELVEDLTD